MTDQKNKKSAKGEIVAAGLAGVALGAVSVYLSDKKNQEKVSQKLDQKLNDIRAWKEKTMQISEETGDKISNELDQVKQKTSKKIKDQVTKMEEGQEVNPS